MAKYVIVPKTDYVSNVIAAVNKDEAMSVFATTMDLDMNLYFEAIPAEKYKEWKAEKEQKAHENCVISFMEDELMSSFGLCETDATEVAKTAYDIYSSGKSDLTEYECIEEAYAQRKEVA